MGFAYTPTPSGYFADLTGSDGSMQATIHRPSRNTGWKWRLCYATCRGKVKEHQGKVRDFGTLNGLKNHLVEHAKDIDPKHATVGAIDRK